MSLKGTNAVKVLPPDFHAESLLEWQGLLGTDEWWAFTVSIMSFM